MSNFTRTQVQEMWDEALFISWGNFGTINDCFGIFLNKFNGGVRVEDLFGTIKHIATEYNLKRIFIKNKGSDELKIVFGAVQTRVVLCQRIPICRSITAIPMEELTLDGFLYFIKRSKWRRCAATNDKEINKQRLALRTTEKCFKTIKARELSSGKSGLFKA